MADLDKDKYRYDEATSTLYTTDRKNISVLKGRLDEENGKLYIGTEAKS